MTRRSAQHALMVLAPLLGSAGFAQPGSQKDEKALVEEFRAFAKEEAATARPGCTASICGCITVGL